MAFLSLARTRGDQIGAALLFATPVRFQPSGMGNFFT